jgi:hypothetical protein
MAFMDLSEPEDPTEIKLAMRALLLESFWMPPSSVLTTLVGHAQHLTSLALFQTGGAMPGYANRALEELAPRLTHLTLTLLDPFTSAPPPPMLAKFLPHRASASRAFCMKSFIASCVSLKALILILPGEENIVPTLSCLTAKLEHLVVGTQGDAASGVDTSDLTNALKLPTLDKVKFWAIEASCWRGSTEGDKARWEEACRARGIEIKADTREIFALVHDRLQLTSYNHLAPFVFA